MKNKVFFLLIYLSITCLGIKAVDNLNYFTTNYNNNCFPLIHNGKLPDLFIDSNDFFGIIELTKIFAEDIQKISGNNIKIKLDNKQ